MSQALIITCINLTLFIIKVAHASWFYISRNVNFCHIWEAGHETLSDVMQAPSTDQYLVKLLQNIEPKPSSYRNVIDFM